MTDTFDNADFYDCYEFSKVYTHTSPRAAASREWRCELSPKGITKHAPITVYAFKRVEWPEAEWIATQVLDALEHELGEYIDPDNGITWKASVKRAALKLADEVRKRHKPWPYAPVASRAMSIAEWRRYGR